MFSNSKIFLVDEDDDGYGFMCSECSHGRKIYVMFWAADRPAIKTSYLSHEYLYEKAKEFVKSLLVDISPIHIAQHRMCNSYIDWYEKFYKSL